MDSKNLVSKRNPWMIACIALVVVLIVMSFGLGYLLATSQADHTEASSSNSAAQTDSQSNSASQNIDLTQLKKTMNSDKNKPTIVNDEGGILFSRNGYGETIENVPTVSLYEEPMCPYCGMLNRQID